MAIVGFNAARAREDEVCACSCMYQVASSFDVCAKRVVEREEGTRLCSLYVLEIL